MSEKYVAAQKIIEEKNEFLIEASGSILSNIVSICGFSRALLDGIGGALSEKQQKYLNIINTNSKDLNYDLEKLFALFKLESQKVEYNNKGFDLISLIKSIDRVYKKDFQDKKIIFNLDYSTLTQRDCFLDGEIIEYILRCVMDIFLRFSNLGKCSLNTVFRIFITIKCFSEAAVLMSFNKSGIQIISLCINHIFSTNILCQIFSNIYDFTFIIFHINIMKFSIIKHVRICNNHKNPFQRFYPRLIYKPSLLL